MYGFSFGKTNKRKGYRALYASLLPFIEYPPNLSKGDFSRIYLIKQDDIDEDLAKLKREVLELTTTSRHSSQASQANNSADTSAYVLLIFEAFFELLTRG